ncbi:hypothetical protein QR46_3365 [Giardia duodenalis assemblage B]|uniref:Uncharacterized protein n=2 Tax=Giardia intestinalis TaxID=5741 RepID=A0A132NRI0_GIAIN|nr:hypothetical protein QR46_3365 [Giardia intestinalis assemblage B]
MGVLMNRKDTAELSPGYFGFYDGDELVQLMEQEKEREAGKR